MEPQKRGWSGSTDETITSGAMVGGKWWEPGDEISCIFNREFETKYGPGYDFLLVKPKTLTVYVDEFGIARKKPISDTNESRMITRLAIPPLAGFDMAYQALKAKGFPGFQDL